MTHESSAQLREILSLDTIAVVGCSTTPGKAARTVPKYMMANGYEIIPINPTVDEVLGKPAYDSLADVEESIDIVNVFRPPNEIPQIVDAVLDRDDVCVLWLQQGIEHDEAADRAREHGITVVQDRCIRVEHRRLFNNK